MYEAAAYQNPFLDSFARLNQILLLVFHQPSALLGFAPAGEPVCSRWACAVLSCM